MKERVQIDSSSRFLVPDGTVKTLSDTKVQVVQCVRHSREGTPVTIPADYIFEGAVANLLVRLSSSSSTALSLNEICAALQKSSLWSGADLEQVSRVLMMLAMRGIVVMERITFGRHTPQPQPAIIRAWHPLKGRVSIGNFCSIASPVEFILNSDAHDYTVTTTAFLNYLLNQKFWAEPGFHRSQVISIGHDVWVGSGSTFVGDIRIGNGAVVAAKSVVTTHVPDYAIVAGNPAKVIRYRFPEPIIEGLIDLKWWEWSDEEIRAHIHLLQGDPAELLDMFGKHATHAPDSTTQLGRGEITAHHAPSVATVLSLIRPLVPSLRSEIGPETCLLSSGLLNSLTSMELVAKLEDVYACEIPLTLVRPESFDTASKIVEHLIAITGGRPPIGSK